ncbi:phosphoribosylaminoimidazole carboxylase [Porphyridium purpureum]|uniref:phosphoribosylaminoimidazole carboxylase n=1 Tax=Porphyridium purpureum TaxID=35688 RepID=A0A5J4Z0E5_PORPP|nr:phosphoribosylaminoimidazole carboxylase [Porphyridium purpureum]|eukprot:POR9455..scf209_3
MALSYLYERQVQWYLVCNKTGTIAWKTFSSPEWHACESSGAPTCSEDMRLSSVCTQLRHRQSLNLLTKKAWNRAGCLGNTSGLLKSSSFPHYHLAVKSGQWPLTCLRASSLATATSKNEISYGVIEMQGRQADRRETGSEAIAGTKMAFVGASSTTAPVSGKLQASAACSWAVAPSTAWVRRAHPQSRTRLTRGVVAMQYGNTKPVVVILMGSAADEPHCEKIASAAEALGMDAEMRIASAHKIPARLLEVIAAYQADPRDKVYVSVAGRSNALSGMLDCAVSAPVIACPPYSDAFGGADLFSSIRMPGGVSPMLVLDPAGAALAAAKILGVHDRNVRAKVEALQKANRDRLFEDDAKLTSKRKSASPYTAPAPASGSSTAGSPGGLFEQYMRDRAMKGR